MKAELKFRKTILDQLHSSPYVLLDPIPYRQEKIELSILIRVDDIASFVSNLKQIPELSNLSIVRSFIASTAIITFDQNIEFTINLVHKLTHKSLVYMDEEKVFDRRVKRVDGYVIPCVEHIFELRILKAFLDLKGIDRNTFKYFSDFHILVQEGLLDYFNMKYNTTFLNIYQLTDFDNAQRGQIIKKLKNEPANKFIKSINVRWHDFLGFIKQAKIV